MLIYVNNDIIDYKNKEAGDKQNFGERANTVNVAIFLPAPHPIPNSFYRAHASKRAMLSGAPVPWGTSSS